MALHAAKFPNLRAKLIYERRRFFAWWEGYAFDDEVERAALLARFGGDDALTARSKEHIVAEAIWGAGRLEPGSPAWTMRLARMLEIPLRARALVFGAEAGAPVNDLVHGTRWKTTGLTRVSWANSAKLRTYATAMERIRRNEADGALCLFELHRETNPKPLIELTHNLVRPGGAIVFADYTSARKGARLRACFPDQPSSVLRTETELFSLIAGAGLLRDECFNDTSTYLPLIAAGWASWRRTYNLIADVKDVALRQELMRALSDHAALWAERYEALRAGMLRVTVIRARKP